MEEVCRGRAGRKGCSMSKITEDIFVFGLYTCLYSFVSSLKFGFIFTQTNMLVVADKLASLHYHLIVAFLEVSIIVQVQI